MKNLFAKLFSMVLFFSLSIDFSNAQTMGKAGGNVLNFFNTSPAGGQIGHLQSGVFGTFTSNSRWIGIGQPNVPSGQELYGMRIQDRQYVGTFSLNEINGNPFLKDLDITYGFVPILSTFPPPPTNKVALNFKFIENGVPSLKMKLTAGGTLGINLANPSSFYKLDVAGRTRCTFGVWSASDKRYKEGIKGLTNVADKLAQIEGVTYRFKKEMINGVDFTEQDDRNEIGFIAQDLEKVFPDLVLQDENGYYSVRYEGMIPVLVEGFNAQQEKINEQESTIDALNAKVDKLENQLQQILAALDDGDAASINISPKLSKDQNAVLDQNRPNPFRGITTIAYQLPKNTDNARLVIRNIEGSQVKSYNVTNSRGSLEFDGSNLAAGTYFYTLMANGEQLAQQKMVVQ